MELLAVPNGASSGRGSIQEEDTHEAKAKFRWLHLHLTLSINYEITLRSTHSDYARTTTRNTLTARTTRRRSVLPGHTQYPVHLFVPELHWCITIRCDIYCCVCFIESSVMIQSNGSLEKIICIVTSSGSYMLLENKSCL